MRPAHHNPQPAKTARKGLGPTRTRAAALIGVWAASVAVVGCDAKESAAPVPETVLPASPPTSAAEPKPPPPLVMSITGKDFEWHSRYPGPDGQLETNDDVWFTGDLHCPVDQDIEIHLYSADYVYRFSLPQFRLQEIAVPDLKFQLQFKAKEEGTYELRGDQICGYAHPSLLGTLVVESRQDYDAWIEKQTGQSPLQDEGTMGQ